MKRIKLIVTVFLLTMVMAVPLAAYPANEEIEALLAALVHAIDSASESVNERSEILSITSTDGYVFQSRLTIPAGDGPVAAIVIDTGTSGPNTYLMTRYVPGIGFWNFMDFWANEFANNGVAFMTANTRGVTHGTQPPFFVEVDEAGYLTYLPSNVVEDVYHMLRTVRENPRLADAKIFLIGMSEGAQISTLFEYTHPGLADVLLLTGVPITNMYDVVHWQASGGAVMMMLEDVFEMDEYGRINRDAFYAGPWETAMGAPFDVLDLNEDGFFTVEDLLILWHLQGMPPHMYDAQILLDAIERGDDEWMRENYPILLTSGWFQEHFALRPNMDLIPELYLPIYIFHGTLDANVHVRYVRELYARLQELGRANVTVNIFYGHNHDLNWDFPAFFGEMSEGIQAIFDAVFARIPAPATEPTIDTTQPYVPLRLTAYAHGATVEWNNETRAVIVTDSLGAVRIINVERVGGFIENGTVWIPSGFAVEFFV
ncbi:MAG: copper amine oxidase N-terminal domain-containing protein [Defluviitaleaceae bacterium]|nr:copper amine oxidase N-terminal domain-containing protein [Defluviitaleaceae bacterium]MCL2218079.1 copper amine oxidase N-terminal domain-containing protein [Defluviitaleaceae bacterium]